MKIYFTLLILFFSTTHLFSQSSPATKDDMKIIQGEIKRLDEKFGLLLQQIDKRFEQVDKRFEQMDKRFEDMQTMMFFGFGLLASAIGVLYIRLWTISDRFTQSIARLENSIEKTNSNLTNAILKLENSIQTKFSKSSKKTLDASQFISILEESDEKEKQKIKELLHI